MIAKKEFKCPECGSSHFGTTDCVAWVNPVGHCHGDNCNFKWCRKTQDEEVFTNATKRN